MKTVNDQLKNTVWNNDNVPSEDFVKGIGGLLVLLSNSFNKIARVEKKRDADFGAFVLESVGAMVIANLLLKGVNWNNDNVPSKEYVEGIGGLLVSLSDSFSKITKIERKGADFDVFVSESVESMKKVNSELEGVTWNNDNVPSQEYVKGFGDLIVVISEAFSSLNRKGLNAFKDDKGIISDFIVNSSAAISAASIVLSIAKFDTDINKEWVDDFSYFMIKISKLVDKNKFDNSKIKDFSLFSVILMPSVILWSTTFSKVNFENVPTRKYTTDLTFYLDKMDDVVSKWKTDVDESKIFKDSIKNIFDSFTNIPNLDQSVLNKMGYINDSLNVLNDIVSLKVFKKSKKMSDFSESLDTIVTSMQVMSVLKPIPGGVTQGYIEFLENLKNLPDVKIKDKNLDAIEKIAESFVNLANSLVMVNSNLEKFVSLYKGIPSIDTEGVGLNLIDNKQDVNIINYQNEETQTSETTELATQPDTKTEEKAAIVSEADKQKQFYTDISDIKNILYEIRENLDKPSQAPSFN
jgi:hypothetical protein